MMVWLVCFLLLFAIAELFDWLKAFNLPLPIYIVGGVFLAIASNYDKIIGSYFAHVSGSISTQEAQLNLPDANVASISCSQTLEKAKQSEPKI